MRRKVFLAVAVVLLTVCGALVFESAAITPVNASALLDPSDDCDDLWVLDRQICKAVYDGCLAGCGNPASESCISECVDDFMDCLEDAKCAWVWCLCVAEVPGYCDVWEEWCFPIG